LLFVFLVLPHLNLAVQSDWFSEQEVWSVISSLPPDKAPGPDNFTTRFLQVAWPIIRPEFMAAFDALWHLDTHNLHNVNDALIVLLPKSVEATTIYDYHLISLIHSVGKLFTKVLANRLAPRLAELI
jgi:hypothetical protein